MTNTVKAFLTTHRADDIYYAMRNPAYFGLCEADINEIGAFVFSAINKATEAIEA